VVGDKTHLQVKTKVRSLRKKQLIDIVEKSEPVPDVVKDEEKIDMIDLQTIQHPAIQWS
jgi:hypothetical protein